MKYSDDIFLLDFLQEIKDIIKINDIYFLKEYYDKNISSYLNKNVKYIPKLTLEKDFYEEIIKIFCNKIIRKIKPENIILVKCYFNSQFKIINGNKTELEDDEKNFVKKCNDYLEELYEIYDKVAPYANCVEMENKLYIIDNVKMEFDSDDNFKLELNERISTVINNKECFINERVHPSIKNIRYYFEKAKFLNKEKLIIVFSSFSTDKPKYNYIKTLKFIDCNKLFILDEYGTKGSYYIGLNGELDIETSVMSLITKIMNENNIKYSNVISVGSSKGGSAALYYGLKYNFSTVIAGAPQYKIGSYLTDLSIKDYGKDIFGEINESNRIKYDNIIGLCSNKSNCNIYILTGDGDNQYQKVLKEFEYVSKEFNLNLNIDKCNIKNHGEISIEFPKYLNIKLEKVLTQKLLISSNYSNIVNKLKKIIKIKTND